MTMPAAEPAPGPRLSVLAVVMRTARPGPPGTGPGAIEVLLVRRANPPQAGHWGFPGGKVDWGEPVGRAAIRELKEETGIDGANPAVFDTVDLIVPAGSDTGPDAGPGATYHHLMVAVRLDWHAGAPVAGDDALEARWAPVAALPRPLCADVAETVMQALARRP